jgi:hypothetical protein
VTATDDRADRDLVAALLGVPGVASAAVEPGDTGPGTLRLQLVSGVDEVQVAGEVNRLLRSQFGLAVDADRVRVLDEPGPGRGVPLAARVGPTVLPTVGNTAAAPAPLRPAPPPAPPPAPLQLVDEPAPSPAPARTGRLVIERVQMVSAGLGVTVTVTLGGAGATSVSGEAEGAATTLSLHRSVASATLRAVEAVVQGKVRFDVEHVEIANTGEGRTALVVISLLTDRGTQRLCGASVVREDPRQAVIRAVLAAVNRRIEPMLTTAGEGAD